uniref:Uncharacterized protein n=1 Tax=Ditylum brightwellii TaxID=49249 RepID=A0A6U3QYP5_9STRA
MIPKVDATNGNEILTKNTSLTYLETYDCETTKLPKPDFGWRAQKQIYKPEFVLNHYIHYSPITNRVNTHPNAVSLRYVQAKPYERRVDELKEGFLLHTKTTEPGKTNSWKTKCSETAKKENCPVGIAYTDQWGDTLSASDNDAVMSKLDKTWMEDHSLGPNCYRHKVVQEHLVSMLEKAMKPYLEKYNQR